jgi:hypothetical protein
MRAAVALPLLALTTALAACGSAQPPAETAASPAETAAPSTPADARTAEPSGAAPAGSGAPSTVADCKALATSESTSGSAPLPEPAAGSKQSDRMAAIMEVMKAKRPAFRCCFDIWAGKIPEARLYTKVKFSLQLDPAGKVKKAVAGPEENGPEVAGAVGGCLTDVAGAVAYPKSPSSRDTEYTHHFDFKPKNVR